MKKTLALCTAMALSAVANAETGSAVLSQASGSVMVNTGASYAPLQVGTALQPDHRLMVMADSTATIQYSNGCSLDLSENQIVQVGSDRNCLQVGGGSGGTSGGGTGGGSGGTGGGSGGGLGGIGTDALIFGGFVVAGGIAAANGNDGGGGNNPDISN